MKYTPVDQIPSIVRSLRETFDSGLTKDLSFRKQQLKNLIRCMEENTALFEEVLFKDLHKHKVESYSAEISCIMDESQYMIKNLGRFTKPISRPKRFKMNMMDKTVIRREPKGVVLVIGAWNYPVHLLLLPVVGAIAAGNCVVIKPSEVSENTAELMARILPQYLDKRAYSVVNGGVEETTALLEEKLDHIFYTGNGTVGRIVMTAAAKHLTPVTLELGGKSPAVITEDADISVTAHRLIWGKFYNAGQTCVAPDYVLVPKSKIDAYAAEFRKTVIEYYTSNQQTSDSYGRIVATRHFDRLKSILDKVDKSKIIIGGETDRDNLFIAPTIVSPVSPDDANLMQDELFGPILPLVPIEDIKEAVKIINSRGHPLALYIFAKKESDYKYILDHTQSGGTLVNDTLMHLQETSLPFGGIGPSGMGSYHGKESFETFTHNRSTMIKSTALEGVMKVRYPPYNDDKYIVFKLMLEGLPSAAGEKIKTLIAACGSAWRVLFASDASSKATNA